MAEGSEKRVAPLELFFDLVFVFALTQVTQLMSNQPTWKGLGQGMLVHSLNELSSEFVALFLLLEPILAGVGAWVLFSEQLSFLNLVAFAIALLGIYLSLSSPCALRDKVTQPSLVTLQVETDLKNREQEVVKVVLNSCIAKNA